MSHMEYLEAEPNFLHSELSEMQDKRIRKESRFGNLYTWSVQRFIVKSGDDLRLEQFAMQLISLMN